MNIDYLIKMANQIGNFFESQPDPAEAHHAQGLPAQFPAQVLQDTQVVQRMNLAGDGLRQRPDPGPGRLPQQQLPCFSVERLRHDVVSPKNPPLLS